MSTALITGITGQDGSYLSQLLLKKDYQVIGMVSPKNDIGEANIKDFKDKLILEPGDLLDYDSLKKIITKHKPDEIYNLAGISFIPASWDKPALTYDVNALGPLRILEIIHDFSPKSKFLQATSMKIYGSPKDQKITLDNKYNPKSPYAVSKLDAHISTQLFREQFQLFTSSVVLFNHESQRRGVEFVSRKITQTAAKIKLGLEKKITLGNLDTQIDWGYAPDYVRGMWQILNQNNPEDFILATGKLHTIKEVCNIAFSHLDLDYQDYVVKNKKFYQETPPKAYYGDPSKAEKKLNWQRKVDFKQMIVKMVEYDLSLLKNL
jgi:GDPmannose 4,6-dehydratase